MTDQETDTESGISRRKALVGLGASAAFGSVGVTRLLRADLDGASSPRWAKRLADAGV